MILYLDTSSLLKLFIEEPGTPEVQSRLNRAEVVATSLIAYPEAHAAFARRRREGCLTKHEFQTVLERFRETWYHFLAVILSTPIYIRAGQLAVAYGLRGMNGIHLASCIELRKDSDRVEFLSHDLKLMRSATKELKKYKS